ncbi:hypothetical protein B0H13DRAFT_2281318 [Mycena leptocephala]|nr:hypothetical protein B0H13DRAFT_2281318 [Mycena leptocephala]
MPKLILPLEPEPLVLWLDCIRPWNGATIPNGKTTVVNCIQVQDGQVSARVPMLPRADMGSSQPKQKYVRAQVMLSSHFLSWKERNELAKDFLEQKPPDVLQPELNAPVPGAIVSNLRPNPSVIRDRVINFWEEMQNTWTSTETQGSQNRDAYLNPLEVRWPTFHSISDLFYITFKVTFAVGTSQTKLSESFARIRESEASLFRLGPLQVAGAPIQFKYTLDIMICRRVEDYTIQWQHALEHWATSSAGSARFVCTAHWNADCASDDTRIDHVDGPLDKTELVQGVQQQCGGPNARRPMTVTGSPACRVPERDNEDGVHTVPV